jgi:hypothetical protein
VPFPCYTKGLAKAFEKIIKQPLIFNFQKLFYAPKRQNITFPAACLSHKKSKFSVAIFKIQML